MRRLPKIIFQRIHQIVKSKLSLFSYANNADTAKAAAVTGFIVLLANRIQMLGCCAYDEEKIEARADGKDLRCLRARPD
jgi:hypothetical protein